MRTTPGLVPTRFDNGQWAPKTWLPIESSNLEAGAYVADTQRLYVEFTNGSIYRYEDVDEEELEAIASSESPGRTFYEHIKLAGYDYERVA